MEGRDEVEISREARRAAEVDRLVAITRDLADVREDRVNEARARVEQRRYRDDEVILETARRLLGG